jgi:hypothetical protein
MYNHRFLAVFAAVTVAGLSNVFSQTFSYRMISEMKGEYNIADENSSVNPNNTMNVSDFNSFIQLYPVFAFGSLSGGMDTKLQLEVEIKNHNFENGRTDISFQELYSQFSLDEKHFLVIGKKRLDWGTGMVWNPANFFIQKDPLRTQNRLEGIFMLNYACLFGNHALNFYVFPEKKAEDCSLALKYDYSGNPADAGFSFVKYGKFLHLGYEISYGGDRFTAYSEGALKNYSKRYRVDDAGNTVSPGLRRKTFGSEFVAGATVLLNSRFSFTGEYRFREDGLNRNEINRYRKYLPANPPVYDPISMGRHTLFGNVGFKDLYSRWSANLRSFCDPLSGQLLVSPSGTVTANNFQIELSFMFYNNSFAIYDFQTSLLVSCFF